MRYFERPPHPALAAHVECLWALDDVTGDLGPAPSRIFPDGCVELIVHAGARPRWDSGRDGWREQPGAFVVGQLSSPLALRTSPGLSVRAVRFRPAGASAFLGAAIDAFADRVTPLDALWGDSAAGAIAEALGEAGGGEALAVLERALLRRLDLRHDSLDATRAGVALLLERRGAVRIEEVARSLGWSERRLERRFAREVGCSPRQLARTVRFQHLLLTLQGAGDGDWAGLAWDCGFADQAHLIREFRRFTGATPTRLREDALDLARRFVAPDRLRAYFRAPDTAR
jgi:AraC-like DNA-binding protein